MTRSPAVLRIYFSLRSPFSRISLHAIEATRPEVLQISELLPYWDPAPETLQALQVLGGDYHYTQNAPRQHTHAGACRQCLLSLGDRGCQPGRPLPRPVYQGMHTSSLYRSSIWSGSRLSLRYILGQEVRFSERDGLCPIIRSSARVASSR